MDGDGKLNLLVVNAQGLSLFRNNGDSTFSDATREAGLITGSGGRALDFADYDGDGDVDIYVVNKGQANVLYRGSIRASK